MKTLTVTAARQRLGYWLKRAGQGESIGVVSGATVIALRPVGIVATGYMETEYGMTTAEADRAAARVMAEVGKRESVPYAPGLIVRENRSHQKVSRPGKKARRR